MQLLPKYISNSNWNIFSTTTDLIASNGNNEKSKEQANDHKNYGMYSDTTNTHTSSIISPWKTDDSTVIIYYCLQILSFHQYSLSFWASILHYTACNMLLTYRWLNWMLMLYTHKNIQNLLHLVLLNFVWPDNLSRDNSMLGQGHQRSSK